MENNEVGGANNVVKSELGLMFNAHYKMNDAFIATLYLKMTSCRHW